MLKALIGVRMQAILAALFKGTKRKKSAGPAMKVLLGLLAAYVIGCFGFLFVMLFYGLYEPLNVLSLRTLYWAIAGFLALVIGFAGSVFGTQSQLYDAKDNELLLAMPVKPRAILLSRMISLYLYDLGLTLLVMLPAGGVYWFMHGADVMSVLAFLLGSFLLPLGSLTLSCLLGWVLAWLGSHMRNKSLLSLIVSLAFFGVYFLCMFNSEELIPMLLRHYEEVASFMKTAGWPAWQLGMAAARADKAALIRFILCMVLPFAAVLYVLGRSFIGIATRQKGGARVAYKKRAMKVTGVRAALLKKELRHFAASTGWMMNGGIGLIFLLALPIVLMANMAEVRPLLEELSAFVETGDFLLYAGMIGCMVLGMCTISAASVSMEAKTLWLIKSLPVEPSVMLMAKAELQMVISLPFALAAGIMAAVALPADALRIALEIMLLLTYAVMISLLDTALNVRFPKFDWTSEAAAAKQGVSVLFAMLLGWGMMLIPGGLYVWLGRDVMSPAAFTAVLIALYALVSALCAAYLKKGGVRRFEAM